MARAAKKPAGQAKKPASGQVVEVIGPAAGFWRCGRHFGATPVAIPLEEISEQDLARLKAEPRLAVAVRPAPDS